MNARRKKIEKMINDVFNALDNSGTNAKKYKNMLSKLSDDQFDNFMKKFAKDDRQNFYLEIIPFEQEPKLQDIKKAADIINVPLEEHVYMPFVNGDKENPVKSPYPVPVGYLHLKRLQQMLSKKNTSSIEIDQRNQKTGYILAHCVSNNTVNILLIAGTTL